jgi:hypothetical protein
MVIRFPGRYPALGAMFKMRNGSLEKVCLFGIPNKVLNTDVRPMNEDQVERIGFGSRTSGNAGTGLNHQCGAMGDLVAAGGGTGERHVGVTGKVEVRFAGRKGGDHMFRSADEMFVMNCFQKVERMVRDENLNDPRINAAEKTSCMVDLSIADTAVGESEGSCRVHSENDDLLILICRPQIIRDVLAVIRQRPEKPREHVVQRNIVVSGHNDLRIRNRLEKLLRLLN